MNALRAIARHLPHGKAQDQELEAFAAAAAARYEAMLGLDRPLSERLADFDRIEAKAPVLHRSAE
jgi:hypothetical protein